jgi:hypothetical protein
MGGIALNNLNLCAKVVFHDSKFNLDFSKRIVSQFESYIDSTKQMFIKFWVNVNPLHCKLGNMEATMLDLTSVGWVLESG